MEEPPYLEVGTDVSAKYRGAFCEANIKSVKKLVKCKVALILVMIYNTTYIYEVLYSVHS